MTGLGVLCSQVAQDLRYAWRSLARSPGFAIAATLTIGLGVGVNTGIFSVLNAVAFRDLPATQPEELVAVHKDGVPPGHNYAQFSNGEYEAYRDQSETLSGVLAYARMWLANLGGDDPQQIVATPVSCNYFDVLRLPPRIGGGFTAAHCENAGDSAVVVITHDLWVSRFGSDTSILERTVTVNGNEFQVVGVAPEGFTGIDIDKPSLFVPLQAQRLLRPNVTFLDDDAAGWLNLVGRRVAGVSSNQVEAELQVIAGRFDAEQPERRATRMTVTRATPLSAPAMRASVLGTSAIVMTAFALVLLVACTNVANLMLARADTRIRETAIRLSLGATRARLVRQFITESVLISVIGGLLGAVLAVWAFQGLLAAALAGLPLEMGTLLRIEAEPDLRVFGFAVALSVLAGVGFGLTPAFTATRQALRMTIEQNSPGSGQRTSSRLQGALVGAQVALSMVLVVATALLLRGLYEARTVDPDFDYEALVVVVTDMQSFGYDGERAMLVQRQAIDGIRALPGVEDVAQALITPLEPQVWNFPYRLPEEAEFKMLQTNSVSANYFAVTGISIVRGRAFTEAEVAAERPSAVILTESTARSIWPDQEPIGRTLIAFSGGIGETSLEVVGITRDVEVVAIGETDTAYLYSPATPSSQPHMQLVVRTALPVESLRAGINAVFARLDSQLPVTVRPLAQNFEHWTRLSGLAASLSLGLGALALVLASVGVFGVMSTVLVRRMREIGIRLALGADKSDVLRLVLRKSLRPVAVGAIVGALACFGVARLLSRLLFGVGALDPYALAGAAAAVSGAAFLASAIPARRALSVDPMTTLRYE